MECPKCRTQLPPPSRRRSPDSPVAGLEGTGPRSGDVTPEEALRVESPPAPCPQCGWSTMWNE
jgi:hypothetical protein